MREIYNNNNYRSGCSYKDSGQRESTVSSFRDKSKNDSEMQNLEIPVGDRLRYFINHGEQITDDKWVLSVIKEGYKLEFVKITSKYRNKTNSCQFKRYYYFASGNRKKLLEKQAIEPVPPAEIRQGFYGTFFLVPKNDWRFTTSDKSKASKSVSPNSSFQNGPKRQAIYDQ